jgi:hypothetical protein
MENISIPSESHDFNSQKKKKIFFMTVIPSTFLTGVLMHISLFLWIKFKFTVYRLLLSFFFPCNANLSFAPLWKFSFEVLWDMSSEPVFITFKEPRNRFRGIDSEESITPAYVA